MQYKKFVEKKFVGIVEEKDLPGDLIAFPNPYTGEDCLVSPSGWNLYFEEVA